jgi:hypothetical protein
MARYINISMDISELEKREIAASFLEKVNLKDRPRDASTAFRDRAIELSEQKNISYRDALNIAFEEAAAFGLNKDENPYMKVLDELVGPLSISFLKASIVTEKDEERIQIHQDALRIQILDGISYRDAVLKALKARKK